MTHTLPNLLVWKPLTHLGWLALLCLTLLGGCRTEGEVFVAEATLVGDATEGYGPYRVEARLTGRRAVEGVTLWWTTLDRPAPVPVRMDRAGTQGAWAGAIEAPEELALDGLTTRTPFALGTRIYYWIEFESEGARSTSPVEAPEESWHFVVGPARQPITIGGISPETGPSTGGTRVFLHGTGFRPGSDVVFGSSAAGTVIVHSSHLIEAVTPAARGGLSPVVVRSPDGQRGTLEAGFFFIAPPSPASVTPASGPEVGGTRVVIAGSDFEAGATVTFDGQPALAVAVLSPGEIFATTPPGRAGPVDVGVTNPDGQAGALPGGFTYVPAPEIDGIAPPAGPIDGGQRVSITGRGFQAGARVFFDGLEAEVISATEAQLRVNTPPHPAGLADVTVINPDNQRDARRDGYAYLGPPALLEVTPESGPTTGQTEVTLLGINFFDGMEVTFDGLACQEVVVFDASRATCLTPPHPEGAVDVTITNIDGQSDTLRGGYEYVPPPPEIVSITPTRGPDLGGAEVVIEVRFAQPGIQVAFDDRGGRVVDVTFEGDVALVTVITPAHPEGLSDVTVTNPDGLSDTATDGYRFVGPPIIDAITPAQGPDTGGQRVTIEGRNFLEGMTVTIDGQEAVVVDIDVEAGTAVVITPAHPEGFADVTVTNPDGRTDTAPDGYEYILLPPTIDALVPDRGPVWGGNEVIIEGSSFREGLQVLVNGVVVPATRLDANTIRLVMPPGPEGAATVEVINPDNQADEATYTYVAPRLTPARGLTAGFTNVVIDGLGFDERTTVRFDGAAAEVTFVSPERLIAITPAGAVGPANVAIETGQGLGDTFRGAFDYEVYVDASTRLGIPEEPGCLETEAGDLDGDGDTDLVIGNGGFFRDQRDLIPNALYFNNGDGSFTRRALNFRENTMNVDLMDLDGDNDLDLLVINLDPPSLNRLYLNNGDGSMNEVSGRFPIHRESYDGELVDFNADGRGDIFLINTAETENFFANNGGARFTNRSDRLPGGDMSGHDHDADFGDLNGDGVPDAVFGVDNTIDSNLQPRYDARNRIFLSAPGGRWVAHDGGELGEVNGDFLEVQVGDVDGDGLDDIVLVDNIDNSSPVVDPLTRRRRNGVLVFINQGGGDMVLMEDAVPDELVGPAVSNELVDLDEDGDLDMVVAVSAVIGQIGSPNPRGELNFLLVNRGDGVFFDATGSWPQLRDLTWDVSPLDANGDGRLDLYFCNFDTPNRLFLRTANP